VLDSDAMGNSDRHAKPARARQPWMLAATAWVFCGPVLFGSGPAFGAVPVEEQSSSREAVQADSSRQTGPLAETRPQGQVGNQLKPGQSAQLFFELQQLRSQVERLQGLAEEQAHELEKLRRLQRDQYVDLDQRLSRGSSSPPVAPASAPKPADASVVDTQVVDGVVVAGTVAAPAGNSLANGQSASEQDRYTQAFELMKAREFDGSIAAFRELLVDHPDGDYAANSRYWLGELFLQKDELEDARSQFESVVDLHPAHQKVPDSLYKLGVVNHRKGRTQQALDYFDDLLNRYPGAPAAGLAESYAAELR